MLLLLLLLLLQLLLPLLSQQALLLLFLFLLLFLLLLFLLSLLLHGLLILLLLGGIEPSLPQCPPLDSRDLGPFVGKTVARRRRAFPRLITNSDWVTLSSMLGRLGGSFLILEAWHLRSTKGRWVTRRDIATPQRTRRDLIATSGRPGAGRACVHRKTHISHRESLRWAKSSQKHERKANHLPGAMGLAPTLSLLAVEGWACSSCLINLGKMNTA